MSVFNPNSEAISTYIYIYLYMHICIVCLRLKYVLFVIRSLVRSLAPSAWYQVFGTNYVVPRAGHEIHFFAYSPKDACKHTGMIFTIVHTRICNHEEERGVEAAAKS